MKLLDTDTCVSILRGRTDVIERRAADPDEVATSWITASELFFGAARSARPAENAAVVTRFLATLPVLPPDLVSARLFGEVKARLATEGLLVADADLFIASVALARGATVITGNRRHFGRIPGLGCEDWMRAP